MDAQGVDKGLRSPSSTRSPISGLEYDPLAPVPRYPQIAAILRER
jgi:hypothetical protein